MAAVSFSRAALNGCLSAHSGCWSDSAFTRSSAKASCTYIGCSHHSVPSLSKVAMRCGAGTKSGEPSRLTAATKLRIDCLGEPSFHDGSGSPCACLSGVILQTLPPHFRIYSLSPKWIAGSMGTTHRFLNSSITGWSAGYPLGNLTADDSEDAN